MANDATMTVTIVTTRTVRRVLQAGRVYEIKPTDEHSAALGVYVRRGCYFTRVAGPKADSTLVVMTIMQRRRAGETWAQACDRTEASLGRIVKRMNDAAGVDENGDPK